ncbi:GNAT family N-acetyltransferase [Saccharothrix sp. NRRL B-16348]|uniref:GNAT family N-acetyltransferase n=1 Tax=Saccharothrix sp. NRRL B-16348 TaxID=1415542 RepID=UPI0009E7DF49|nr:GNAT family N-acetyltransferase [Saccharothrix sp. NRRL B-16348]
MPTRSPDARALRLADGRHVRLTPVTPADREELAEALRNADVDTLFQRFCGAAPPVTPALLTHLTDLDHVRRCAIVARDTTGRGVAIARYEATGEPGAAEVAVVVAPPWRRVGLATAMVARLASSASANGFDRFTATHLAGHRAVARMLRAAGAVRLSGGSTVDWSVPLPSTGPDHFPAERHRFARTTARPRVGR